MRITATVTNAPGTHAALVRTGDKAQGVSIAGKPSGGSALNGGELLMLALATCYCNDLYREAGRLGIALEQVEVEASATFAGIGLAASDVQYTAKVRSNAGAQEIARLLRETDAVAEVHNTLRQGVPVRLLP